LTEITVSAADKRLILTALAVVLLLSALDQSVVSTAMPRIIEQLHGLEMYAWVTTAYLLTSTISVPIYGKLSDLYGRKPILVIGVLLFLIGSALCGLSGEFGDLPLFGTGIAQLIVFRGLQGLGSGALMTVTVAIIADLYSPRERGRLMGLFGSVFGFATVIGPFIGGFFTDHATVTVMSHQIAGWRWAFYVNLPLGLVALFMILYRLPPLRHRGEGKVDYLGGGLLILTFTPLLLVLTLGGTVYAWNSAPIVRLSAVAAASALLFLWVERRTPDALLPLHLFRIKAFSISTLASFTISMSFLGVVMFMPLYMQVVQGVSATGSGLALLPLMATLIVSSTVSGRLVSHTGRYKAFMIGGGVLLVLGVVSLTLIGPNTAPADLAWRLALTGIGLGPAQSLFNVVISNAVPIREIGIATSVSQFSRQIGSTVGVAIFGALLTHDLTAELQRNLPPLPGMAEHKIDLSNAQSQAMNVGRIRANVEAAMQTQYQLLERAYHGDKQAAGQVLADPRMPESVKTPLLSGGAPEQSLAVARTALSAYSSQLVVRIQNGTKQAFSASITQMLSSALWIVITGVLIVLFIPELPLRSTVGAATRVEV
jgi:EmrB/QacA subfamily drug resistance transporter